MKAFYALLLLVFLASCGTPVTPDAPKEPVVPSEPQEEVQEDVPAEIDAEAEKIIEELIKIWEESSEGDSTEQEAPVEAQEPVGSSSETVEPEQVEIQEEEVQEPNTAVESKVVELATSYTNPAGNVDMNISYSLDDSGKISEISVTSPNYKWMVWFNKNAQAVIGMTVEQASEYYVSGSSLTTPAFQKALKNG